MQHIRKALGGFIKDSKVEKGLEQQKALGFWEDVVGEKIAKNAEIETIESGVIVVKTKNSVWRQELQMQKSDIVDRLNKVLTKKVIKDIRFV